MKLRKNIFGVFFVSLLGTLLHFVYDWSGESNIAAIFSSVNESVWEHLKLLFWPMFLYSTVEYFVTKKPKQGLLFSRLAGTVSGMLIITVLYYTIGGVLGKDIDAINIAIYYIAVVMSFVISNIIYKNIKGTRKILDIIAALVFLAFVALFAVWSFYPPEIGIFAIPIL